jgi:hypothetical protein
MWVMCMQPPLSPQKCRSPRSPLSPTRRPSGTSVLKRVSSKVVLLLSVSCCVHAACPVMFEVGAVQALGEHSSGWLWAMPL